MVWKIWIQHPNIKKKKITSLSDNSFEKWVGWYLSHVVLIGACHKKSKIHSVLLFLCLCYWTVSSKIFSVAAFDPNTAMQDIGLSLEWRPYSRRLRGHFSSSSAVVFGFVELELYPMQELSNKLGSNIQISALKMWSHSPKHHQHYFNDIYDSI